MSVASKMIQYFSSTNKLKTYLCSILLLSVTSHRPPTSRVQFFSRIDLYLKDIAINAAFIDSTFDPPTSASVVVTFRSTKTS